jgi:hypothetical protein
MFSTVPNVEDRQNVIGCLETAEMSPRNSAQTRCNRQACKGIMNIALIGATGDVGSRIPAELTLRVTPCTRPVRSSRSNVRSSYHQHGAPIDLNYNVVSCNMSGNCALEARGR